MEWEDTTPRSRDNPDKPASCWTLSTGRVTVTVLNSHRDDPGEWVVTCLQVNLKVKRIGIKSDSPVVLARAVALNLVRKALREMLDSLS